ncbi:DNA alkylation repair protein [Chryseobacterium sp. A301]
MEYTAKDLQEALALLAQEDRRIKNTRFFKTGVGDYGFGDEFLGVTVPDQRKIASSLYSLSLEELQKVLRSSIHEHRSCALFILVLKFEKENKSEERMEIVRFYLENLSWVNNWDLVDSSCYKILGRHCYETNSAAILHELAQRNDLWANRIAIVSTMFHLKKDVYELTKELVLKNKNHSHDLMHKANGWLLREMGKRNEDELIEFLKLHSKGMPRTTLRYAIEKLDPICRANFLNAKF